MFVKHYNLGKTISSSVGVFSFIISAKKPEKDTMKICLLYTFILEFGTRLTIRQISEGGATDEMNKDTTHVFFLA